MADASARTKIRFSQIFNLWQLVSICSLEIFLISLGFLGSLGCHQKDFGIQEFFDSQTTDMSVLERSLSAKGYRVDTLAASPILEVEYYSRIEGLSFFGVPGTGLIVSDSNGIVRREWLSRNGTNWICPLKRHSDSAATPPLAPILEGLKNIYGTPILVHSPHAIRFRWNDPKIELSFDSSQKADVHVTMGRKNYVDRVTWFDLPLDTNEFITRVIQVGSAAAVSQANGQVTKVKDTIGNIAGQTSTSFDSIGVPLVRYFIANNLESNRSVFYELSKLISLRLGPPLRYSPSGTGIGYGWLSQDHTIMLSSLDSLDLSITVVNKDLSTVPKGQRAQLLAPLLDTKDTFVAKEVVERVFSLYRRDGRNFLPKQREEFYRHWVPLGKIYGLKP